MPVCCQNKERITGLIYFQNVLISMDSFIYGNCILFKYNQMQPWSTLFKSYYLITKERQQSDRLLQLMHHPKQIILDTKLRYSNLHFKQALPKYHCFARKDCNLDWSCFWEWFLIIYIKNFASCLNIILQDHLLLSLKQASKTLLCSRRLH
jgi:hypothetical protein